MHRKHGFFCKTTQKLRAFRKTYTEPAVRGRNGVEASGYENSEA
jgi:hypothetical protein